MAMIALKKKVAGEDLLPVFYGFNNNKFLKKVI
jgi:hypothetical protein